MAIRIRKTCWLPKLKSQWKQLYSANPQLSAFQDYDFVLRFWKNYYVYCLKDKEIPVFYVVEEDGEARLIAPLCKKAGGSYIIFGAKNGCEYCDFIYAADSDVQRYLNVLCNQLHAPILFKRVREKSMLYDACKMMEGFRDIDTSINVNVVLPNSHTDYNKSLSKSMRQNIRTAYNRLSKDGRALSVAILNGDDVLSYNYDYATQSLVAAVGG